MIRVATGALIASLVYIAAYVYGPGLLSKLLARGDETEWLDAAKQANYRHMGKAA